MRKKKQKKSISDSYAYMMANYGMSMDDPFNPWQMPQSPNYNWQQGPNPTNYAPQMMDSTVGQQMGVNSMSSPAPQGMMQLQAGSSSPQKIQIEQSRGQKVGSMMKGLGQGLGQAMQQTITGGLQLANALIPNQPMRSNKFYAPVYNEFPQGTGSQAIYEDGGNLPQYKTVSRKKGGIRVTEEVPIFYDNQVQQLPEYTFTAPRITPQAQNRVQFIPGYDYQGNLINYIPQFQGDTSRYQAMQMLPQFPQSFGGIPVEASPETYGQSFTNFFPGTDANAWNLYSDNSQRAFFNRNKDKHADLPQPSFEYGGEMNAKSGIKIKKSKRGTFTKAAKKRGMGVQEFANKVMANKEDYSPAMVKKANFAKNAKGFSHKKAEFGATLSPGTTLDLSPQEIQELIDLGYKISFE